MRSLASQTGTSYIHREPQQYALHFKELKIETLSYVTAFY